MPRPIARWNPARDVWETETTGLFCEHSDVFSATWPSSGTTRSGTAYELPTSAPLTDGSASSSLLNTPTVEDAGRQGSPEWAARWEAGESIPETQQRLRTQVLMPSLLPTPTAMNPNDGESVETWEARRQRVALTAANGNGFGTPLAIAVQLLPTPTSRDHKGANQRQDSTCLHGALLPTFTHGAATENGEDRNATIWARDLSQPQNLENALARIETEQ